MFPKKNRADKNILTHIFTHGKFIGAPHITLKYIIDKSFTSTQISFIVPKTVSKKAVDRNLLRRRGYAVLQKDVDTFPAGFLGAFIFGKKSIEYFGKKSKNTAKNRESIQNLENEIKNILYKFN